MARSGWDILSEYQGIYPDKIRCFDQPGSQRAYPDETSRRLTETEKVPLKVAQKSHLPGKTEELRSPDDKKVIDKRDDPPYSDVEKTLPPLSHEEQQVVEQLNKGQCLRDDLIAALGLPAGKVAALLTMLEIKGLVRRLPGNMLEMK